jgi:hypothetical protein
MKSRSLTVSYPPCKKKIAIIYDPGGHRTSKWFIFAIHTAQTDRKQFVFSKIKSSRLSIGPDLVEVLTPSDKLA